jgi:hypothetical protein
MKIKSMAHFVGVGGVSMSSKCEWFDKCQALSCATVEHPQIGDVEICERHLEWLQKDFSPTKMVPPIVARKLKQIREKGVPI